MPTIQTANPDNAETKKNHLRHRVMLILEALGLETLLGHRKKNIAEAYRGDKETRVVFDALPAQKQEDLNVAKEPEDLSLLDKLFAALKLVVRNVVERTRDAAFDTIRQAQQKGQISQVAAQLARRAINVVYDERTVGRAAQEALTPRPPSPRPEPEAEASDDEELEEEMRATDRKYQETVSSQQSAPEERLNVSLDRILVEQIIMLARQQRQAQVRRFQQPINSREFIDVINLVRQTHNTFFTHLSSDIESLLKKSEFSGVTLKGPFGTFRPEFSSSSRDFDEAELLSRFFS